MPGPSRLRGGEDGRARDAEDGSSGLPGGEASGTVQHVPITPGDLVVTTVPAQHSSPTPAPPDLAAIKGRQQATWASGDYSIIGTTLTIVGESLCEAVDLRAGQSVLDVACGNGAATLAAA